MSDPVADYIAEQPAALAATFAAARAAFEGLILPPRLALVGSGSSVNALLAVEPLFQQGGRPVAVRSPQAFLDQLSDGRLRPEAVVVLSQSGRSTTSIAAAEAALALGLPTVGITAEVDSPFAALPLHRLVMPIGPEPIGPKTKGFTASLAALIALADPAAVPPDLTGFAASIEPVRATVEVLADCLDDLDYILVAGQGGRLGIAQEAALKIAEMAGLPTAAFDTEEALHGRLHGLTQSSLAVFLAADAAGTAAAADVAGVLEEREVAALVLGPAPVPERLALLPQPMTTLPPPFDLIEAVLPFQWLAHALAVRRGLKPEAMRYPGLSKDLHIKRSAEG